MRELRTGGDRSNAGGSGEGHGRREPTSSCNRLNLLDHALPLSSCSEGSLRELLYSKAKHHDQSRQPTSVQRSDKIRSPRLSDQTAELQMLRRSHSPWGISSRVTRPFS